MNYTVGEAAIKLKVAPSTLRYYDKEGLLSVQRTEGGIRIFTGDDMKALAMISCLKKAGMSIKDIKQFMEWCSMGDSTIHQRRELIEKQRRTVEEQIKELNSTLDVLEYKQWYYETAEKAGTCKIHDKLSLEDIPEKFRNSAKKLK